MELHFSNMLPIKIGVLQGSILSHSLLILYADDITLLSASIVALQEMLNICFHKKEELDIILTISNNFCLKYALV